MRYRRKEIGCEIIYSELDLRALEYIEIFLEEESDKAVEDGNQYLDNCMIPIDKK